MTKAKNHHRRRRRRRRRRRQQLFSVSDRVNESQRRNSKLSKTRMC